MQANTSSPLSDINVFDLSTVLAGPLTGSFFAELGARVIKVENPVTNGDVTRRWKLPAKKDGDESAYYKSSNWGKEVIFLNFKETEDRKALEELIKEADIVICNGLPAVCRKLRITYPDMKAIKQDVIYIRLGAFDPENNEPGYDVIMQAEAGWISMTGHLACGPAKLSVALIDVIASH